MRPPHHRPNQQHAEEVNQASEQCKADGKKPMDIKPFKQQTDVTTSVITGKADAFYTETDANNYAIQQTGGQLEQLEPMRDTVKVSATIKKDDVQTREAVQQALQKLMDDGTLKEIMDYWGMGDNAADTDGIITK